MVSWLLLKGRCNFCHEKIPFRYFLVEGLTSLAATASLLRFGMTPTAVIIFALVVALIILTFIDIDWFILPDIITLYGSLVAFVIAVINQFFSIFTDPIVADLWGSLYGVLSGAGFLYVVAQLYLWIRKIDGLGLGDVKLLMMTGILLGLESSIYAVFIGSIIGCIGGSITLLIQKKGLSQSYIPFGPYLAVAICLYLFTGTWLLQKFSQLVSLFLMPLIGL
jgi:leader peptidase (prepilin peptidase)/N-methyltransferase